MKRLLHALLFAVSYLGSLTAEILETAASVAQRKSPPRYRSHRHFAQVILI